MNKRKMKKERYNVSVYDIEGSLKEVREYLDRMIAEYGESAMLEHEMEWDYDEDRSTFYLHYEREETDAEMDKRIKAAAKSRESRKAKKIKDDAAKEERERKELARLQKKYGE